MTKITTKSDVYSFGVVLLEAITGRRPVEAAFGEGRSVVQWVREHLHQKRDPAEVIDQRLQGRPDTQVQEMLQALGIALLCASARPEDRPTMKDVAALLRGLRSDSDGAEARKVSGGCGARPLDSARWAAAASSPAKPTAQQAQAQSTSSSLAYSM
jgi:serine/threonine protein kinase